MQVSSSYGRVIELRVFNQTSVDTDNNGRVTSSNRQVHQARVAWSSGKEGFYDADVRLSVGDVLVVLRVPHGGKTRVHQEVNANTGDWWKRRDQLGCLTAGGFVAGLGMAIWTFLMPTSSSMLLVPVGLAIAFLSIWWPFKVRKDNDTATDAEYERLRQTPEFREFLKGPMQGVSN